MIPKAMTDIQEGLPRITFIFLIFDRNIVVENHPKILSIK